MTKQQMVGDVPGNALGMLSDLMTKLQHGVITLNQLALFLKKQNPFSDPKKIILIEPFNPTEFIGKNWTIWKGPADGDGLSGEEDIDPRSSAFSEIEIDKFLFEICLQEKENRITGETKLCRLKEKTDFILFGANIFLGLWEEYQANKERSVLEFLYKTQNISFMDFPGTVLRSPSGHRDVLCLDRNDDGVWSWSYSWLDLDWDADYPSVGCASQP